VAKRDFLAITDWDGDKVLKVIEKSLDLKTETKKGMDYRPLKGKVMGMIFQKPSLRTRVSFEMAMHQLGGTALYIAPTEISMGTRESVPDVARVMSRYVDVIMARVFGHDQITGLASHSSVPIINGLSDYNHPCQVISDLLTVREAKGGLEGVKIVYVGDGNNLANSWLNAASRVGIDLTLVIPKGYEPDGPTLKRAISEASGSVSLTFSIEEGVSGADVIYTDVWASMGQEAEAEEKNRAFAGFTVDKNMVSLAKKDAVVMHCLPAHRGMEITDEIMDGPQSIVFDQAENRLHGQKGIICELMLENWTGAA
jgi:ornithine carbamoyltransferase